MTSKSYSKLWLIKAKGNRVLTSCREMCFLPSSWQPCFCQLTNTYWIGLYSFPGSKIKFCKSIYMRSFNGCLPPLCLIFKKSPALRVNSCRKLPSAFKMSTCRLSYFGPISSLSLSSLSAGWQMFPLCPTFFICPRPPVLHPCPVMVNPWSRLTDPISGESHSGYFLPCV